MNLFAGNILLEGNNSIKLPEFDYVENLSKNGDKIIFIFGETKFSKTEDLIESIGNNIGKIKEYDISIEGKNNIDIINDTYEEGVYELATFEGEQVDFAEIFDRFKDFDEVVAIREAEISNKFGNKVVKVDFVY